MFLTLTGLLCDATISWMLLTSEQVTPPTTKSSRVGWLVGCGRAELMNKLHKESEEHKSNIRTLVGVLKKLKHHCWTDPTYLKPDLIMFVMEP